MREGSHANNASYVISLLLDDVQTTLNDVHVSSVCGLTTSATMRSAALVGWLFLFPVFIWLEFGVSLVLIDMAHCSTSGSQEPSTKYSAWFRLPPDLALPYRHVVRGHVFDLCRFQKSPQVHHHHLLQNGHSSRTAGDRICCRIRFSLLQCASPFIFHNLCCSVASVPEGLVVVRTKSCWLFVNGYKQRFRPFCPSVKELWCSFSYRNVEKSNFHNYNLLLRFLVELDHWLMNCNWCWLA